MDYRYSANDANDFFMQEDLHFPHVLSPLFASFQIPNQEAGTVIAFETLKMPLERFRCRLYRGRFYQCAVPFAGDPQVRLQQHQEVVQERMPRMTEYYQRRIDDILLPYYETLDPVVRQPLNREQALSQLESMYAFYTTAWAVHFDVIVPRVDVGFMLEDLYRELTGQPDGQAVYELLVGQMNKSLETDRAFWQFATRLQQQPELVARVLQTPGSDMETVLSGVDSGSQWIREMRDLLRVYGFRTSYSHEFIYETWVENPKYGWDLVRSYLLQAYDFEKEFAKLLQRRESARTRFLQGVPDSPQRRHFLELYEMALRGWAIDEDHHFYIDAMLPAKYRPVLLHIGRWLVDSGVIQDPVDIFFLDYAEVLEALTAPRDLRARVATNRREYQEFATEAPVPHLGPLPEPSGEEDLLADRIFGLPRFLKENTPTQIKGYAASRGIHTGIVKIVRDQDEFSKVQAGDVLVCKTTTPPWTVLFSIAGAIVTDAGGILSHAGTVAREYEVPAVLGTKVATQTLHDGDLVTVNGTAGTVQIVHA